MRGGSKAFAQPEKPRRVRTLPGTKVKNDRYERDTACQADRANPVAQEDGNLDRQAKLQPWPHQGGCGRKETHARTRSEARRKTVSSAIAIEGGVASGFVVGLVCKGRCGAACRRRSSPADR